MSPAAADFSHPISSSSQPISQNPTPIYPSSNGACGHQSGCLKFSDEVSNSGLSFDFSNKGWNFLGQSKPTRIRHSVKKRRGKMSISESKDFSNVLRDSVDLSLGNDAGGNANSTRDDLCSGSLEKKAAGCGGVDYVQLGKLGKVGSVFGADGSSSGSNFNYENQGFSLGTNNISSTFSDGSGNFAFGAKNDSSRLNFDNGGVVFGDERNSSVSNFNYRKDNFVFVDDKIRSRANLSHKDVGSVFNAAESSTMKGKGASLFGNDTNDSTLKSSLKGDFVGGSSEGFSSKVLNMRCTKSSPILGHSGAHESNTFDNAGFLFGAKNDKLGSDARLEQKSSNNNCGVQSGDKDMGFVSDNSKTTVKLDAREFCKREGHSSFTTSLGAEWNLGGRKDHSAFSFGATKNDSISQLGKSRIRRSKGKSNFVSQGEKGTAAGNDFQKADLTGLYEFGNSTKEKPSPTDISDLGNEKNNLDGEKPETGSASVKWPSDAMRSSFKFVIGSSSSPGSAFYKVPLSKLFDDMKGLNIDNSKGVSGNDKAKVVGIDSWFGTDSMFSFESNGQASGPVSGKKNQTLNSTEKNSFRNVLNEEQPIHDNNVNRTSQTSAFSSPASSPVQQQGVGFATSSANEVEIEGNLSFAATPPRADACPRDFKYEFSFTSNIFPGLGEKLEFCASSRYMRDNRLKKTRAKLRQRFQAKRLNEQDQISEEGSSPKTFISPGCYSPMDFSPCQDATESVPGVACTSVATEKEEQNSAAERQRSGNNECDKRPGEQDVISSKIHEESKSKPPDENGLSAIRHQYRKKYKLKVGNGLSGKTSVQKSDVLFASAQFSSDAPIPLRIGEPQVQSGVASDLHRKSEGQCAKQHSSEDFMNGECDQWRMRGNQAYKIRDMSKAEEFYTNGINSAREKSIPGFHAKPLLLCYTNRAATRMSLGRLREALEDCKFAATLDPSFLKAKLRAANCHLVLGEFQEAIQDYNYCLESGNAVPLDRKIVIEASEGIQKAQQASEYLCQSANLLQQTTSDAANSALEKIVKGLSISCYSERFLEMKGEALFLLRRYDEVIELCEQTLHIAEKNVSAIHLANESDFECKNSVRLWRWCLTSKCQIHFGRLEVALDLIERQQNSTSIDDWSSSMNQESLIPLAATIRELLHRKKAGNEAFQSGKHLEAVEHYTAAISSSVDSRPFAAICFCNRAAAHQALGLVADAIADCSVAIALDGDYVKAVSRRATLHEMIRDYKQAIHDLQKLISLLENQSQKSAQQSGKVEGSSGSDARELKQAQRRLSLMEEKANQGTPMDFYLILGVKASDSEADIKKAYRKAALKHHPDKAGQYWARTDGGDDGRSWKDIVEKVHEDADRLFKMIGEAYAVLSDADKRSKYDFEEEIRNCRSESKRHSDSGRSSDYHSSPYEKDHWPGRQPNFSSSTFERSRSRRYWQEFSRSYTKSHANSHTRW